MVVWQDIAGVVEYFEDLVISELVLGWALGRSMVNKNIPGRFQQGVGWCLGWFVGWGIHLSGWEVLDNIFGGQGIFSETLHSSHVILRT